MFFPFPTFSGSNKATVSFAGDTFDATDLTTYTFSGHALGTAAGNRKVVVGVTGSGSARTVASVTVGGISATLVKAEIDTDAASELWQADVPTGTTGDVVVVWSGSNSSCGIGVWAVYAAKSAAHDTGNNTADPMVDTLNIPANGVAIGIGCASGAQNPTSAWTNLTEDFDNSGSGEASVSFSGASDAFATLQTAREITQDQSVSPTLASFVLASWGPN